MAEIVLCNCLVAGEAMPIAEASIEDGVRFGPVLLWAAVDGFPAAWTIGEWNGLEWAAAEEWVVEPSHWARLPDPPPCGERLP